MSQSEEIHTFVEEIHTFGDKHLTSQRKPLPLYHLLRERARRYWGVAASLMAQWVNAERLFALGAVELGRRPFFKKPIRRIQLNKHSPSK